MGLVFEKKQLIFYNLSRTFQIKNDKLEDCFGLELLSLGIKDIVSNGPQEEEFTKMYWDVGGRLYLATNQNKLITFCSEKLEVVEEVFFENTVSFMGRVENEFYVLNDSK